jgi:hypothetical protein
MVKKQTFSSKNTKRLEPEQSPEQTMIFIATFRHV